MSIKIYYNVTNQKDLILKIGGTIHRTVVKCKCKTLILLFVSYMAGIYMMLLETVICFFDQFS